MLLRRPVLWFIALLAPICGSVHRASRTAPLAATHKGLVKGQWTEDGYAKFSGVPYAVVDRNNPFGPALPHPGFNGTFEAYESYSCPQMLETVPIGTLDCLTMDISVPSSANSRNLLPVMVWIHGGAFASGNTVNEGGYPDFYIRSDVILISITYRMGIYGFMCLNLPEVSGNQGLKDQVLALRWINENIEAFGGNPKQITIFGSSAGAMAINLHLLSNYEKLYTRAIIQSGPAVSPLVMTSANDSIPLTMAEELGLVTTDLREALAYLATFDALKLVETSHKLRITAYQEDHLFTLPCIEPKFEGVENFITEHPRNIVSSKANSTPVIIGINDNEAAVRWELSGAEYFETFTFGSLLSHDFNFDNDTLSEAVDIVKQFYLGDEEVSEKVRWKLGDFENDFTYGYPTLKAAQQIMNNGLNNVYCYMFSYDGGRNMIKIYTNLKSAGAAHGDELGYLFDLATMPRPTLQDEITIARMISMWTNFAKYGDPTPEISHILPVKWEPITPTSQRFLHIGTDVSMESRPFHQRMAFWELFYRLYGKYLKWQA